MGAMDVPTPSALKAYSTWLKIEGLVYMGVFFVVYYVKIGLAWHDAGEPFVISDIKFHPYWNMARAPHENRTRSPHDQPSSRAHDQPSSPDGFADHDPVVRRPRSLPLFRVVRPHEEQAPPLMGNVGRQLYAWCRRYQRSLL